MARAKKVENDAEKKSSIKKPNEPIYNRFIYAIDQDVADHLSDKLVEGIMDGLQENIFGSLEISHDDEDRAEYVDSMFSEAEEWEERRLEHEVYGIYDMDDYLHETDFKLKDKAKVKRALNGKKDIYTGTVNFELYDMTIEDIFNNLITEMEKKDKNNFKIIQKLEFEVR